MSQLDRELSDQLGLGKPGDLFSDLGLRGYQRGREERGVPSLFCTTCRSFCHYLHIIIIFGLSVWSYGWNNMVLQRNRLSISGTLQYRYRLDTLVRHLVSSSGTSSRWYCSAPEFLCLEVVAPNRYTGIGTGAIHQLSLVKSIAYLQIMARTPHYCSRRENIKMEQISGQAKESRLLVLY